MVRVIFPLSKKKKKIVIFDFVYTKCIICKYRPVSTKLGQNIYVQQNLNEFDHGSNWTGTTGVICSWIGKNCYIWLCLLSSIYKYKPISTKLGHNEYEHTCRSQMSLIIGQVILDQWVLSSLEIEKLNFSSLFGIYFHCYPVLFSTQVSDIGPSWSSCVFSSHEHIVLRVSYCDRSLSGVRPSVRQCVRPSVRPWTIT